MVKMKNMVRGLLHCPLSILIAVLAFTSCQTVSAADYLVATCDGPGGFCSEGSRITVSYKHGGEVSPGKEPNSGGVGTPEARLGYCPKHGDMAGSGCLYLKHQEIPKNVLLAGGWPWNQYIGVYTGTFVIPSPPSQKGEYCVAAWISTYSQDMSGKVWLSFGETTRYLGSETPCVGFAPPPPPPDLCYLNSGNPIEVDFGPTERSQIGTSRDGTAATSKSISVQCMGTGTHTLNVRLAMIPTSWSASQIATSNPALGVVVTHKNQEMKNNDSFEMHVQGNATQTVGFSLLRNPSKGVREVATGEFRASASLIVSEP